MQSTLAEWKRMEQYFSLRRSCGSQIVLSLCTEYRHKVLVKGHVGKSVNSQYRGENYIGSVQYIQLIPLSSMLLRKPMAS
jgi:hypothetical protein